MFLQGKGGENGYSRKRGSMEGMEKLLQISYGEEKSRCLGISFVKLSFLC